MDIQQWLSRENITFALSMVWTGYVVVVGVWILLQRRAPVATLSWLLSMAVLPVVGLGIYYFLGPRRLKRQRLRRLRSRRKSRVRGSMARLREKVPQAPERLHQVVKLVTASTNFPISTADKVELLVGGANTFDSIMSAVDKAQQHIHLEYYIFEPDHTGLALLDALCVKAREGIKVRLLVDALGSKKLSRKYFSKLEEAGGEFALFHPTKFGRRVRPVINFRSHRKIVVIDGCIGYTGGVNITDEEDVRILPEAYHDVHVRLEGPVVNWLQTVFLEDWAYALDYNRKTEPSNLDELLPDLPDGEQVVQIMASGPDNDMEAIHRVHVSAIHAAHQRVWLTTPYFVPTEASMLALTNAALRGVDVCILVPEKSDSKIVTAAARSYFDELISCGVKVFEYHRSMLHSKTMLIDDMVGIIGTANFDNRSFRLNYEVCAVVYGDRFANKLAQQFLEDISHARRVGYARPQSFWQKLGDSDARLCSPLL
ncbi:MAG: cardiolipin synthase [Comamonas sp.]|nr:cardiolipin synthase [Candidatus Comamonas equi]